MVNQHRVEALERYCVQWKAILENSIEGITNFLELKSSGFSNESDDEVDCLQKQIDELDGRVKTYQAILITQESLLDRARNGEDI